MNDPKCGLCGNPRSQHRAERVAHHSECTLEQFLWRPGDRREYITSVLRNSRYKALQGLLAAHPRPTLPQAVVDGIRRAWRAARGIVRRLSGRGV